LCTEELRLILPFLSRFAPVDFLGTDGLREWVEVLLGFVDVLRDRVDDEKCRVDDRPLFCAAADNGDRRPIATRATPTRLNVANPVSRLRIIERSRGRGKLKRGVIFDRRD